MTQAAVDPRRDAARWQVDVTVLKFNEDIDEFRAKGGTDEEFFKQFKPYAKVKRRGNLLMNAGIQRILDKALGVAGQVWDATHARVGVGDSSTAASASQTDLQASAGSTHRYFKVMDSTYPSRSSQTITFQSSFGSSDGNFAWAEWCIDQGTADGNTVTAVMLNRKVESLGTKTTGTWTIQVAITLS